MKKETSARKGETRTRREAPSDRFVHTNAKTGTFTHKEEKGSGIFRVHKGGKIKDYIIRPDRKKPMKRALGRLRGIPETEIPAPSPEDVDLEAIAKEARDVAEGKTSAARVVEITLNPDGSFQKRQVIEPETDRTETARKFEIRSEVAKIRHQLNLSQGSFAKRLGIPLSTVQKWERNATKPTGAAAALMEILRKRPDVIEVLAEK